MATYDHDEINRPRPTPGQMLGRAFWFGFFAHMAATGVIQDWLGKAEYLRQVDQNWMPTRWWMWAALLVWMLWEHWAQKRTVQS